MKLTVRASSLRPPHRRPGDCRLSDRLRRAARRITTIGLASRLAVIVVIGLVMTITQSMVQAGATVLLLASAAVLAYLPTQRAATWPLLAELLAGSLVVGALPDANQIAMTYLTIPVAVLGFRLGVAAAVLGWVGSGAIGWLIHALAHGQWQPMWWWPWLLLGLVVALVSGWRNTGHQIAAQVPQDEPAYANAHRLLSELHLVARHLSLGLDPQTLAQALLDEVGGILPQVRSAVLVRSASGRFVPVVGDPPHSKADSVVMDAWVSADLVRRRRHGAAVAALPVLMGERVVAVVVLADTQDQPVLTDAAIAQTRSVIAQAGPRLASALLFDDVRRLATVDERNRLAREIHDGIAQDMASVGYLLEDIAADADEHTAQRLADLRTHIRGLVSELRLSIFDLRAGVDESGSLAHTLAEHVQRVGGQAGLSVHVSTDEAPTRLPTATEIEVLRIVQEAITNVRRHARARNVWLSIRVDPPAAHITVMDDGRGLANPRPDSMGITGMKERAGRIGAQLSVRNRADGSGVVVDLRIHTPEKTTKSNRSITDAGTTRNVADSPDETVDVRQLVPGGEVS